MPSFAIVEFDSVEATADLQSTKKFGGTSKGLWSALKGLKFNKAEKSFAFTDSKVDMRNT